METIQLLKTKWGALLCNEIMDLGLILKEGIFERSDIIINPSNVPQFNSKNFDNLLSVYASWVYKISGKPVLRFSTTNHMKLYNNIAPESIRINDTFHYVKFSF